MKKSVLIAFVLVSALSVYIGMEVQRRRTPPQGGQGTGGNPVQSFSGTVKGPGGGAPAGGGPVGGGQAGEGSSGGTPAVGSQTSGGVAKGPAPGASTESALRGGDFPRAKGEETGANPYTASGGRPVAGGATGTPEGGMAKGSGQGTGRPPGGTAGSSPAGGGTGGGGGPQNSSTSPMGGGASAGAIGSGAPQSQPRRSAVSVEVVPIRMGTLRDTATFAGTLEARSQFVLSTKIAGRLKTILVDAGDEVRKGQIVALLEEEDYKYPYEQALADLEASKANLEDAQGALETARREYERAKSLHESRIISAAELDNTLNQYRRAEATVKVVQAQVRQREAALSIAKDRLDSTKIVVTWESEEPTRVVGERYANPGSLLRANDPLCLVMDISSLVGVVNVTEQGYTRIRPGQRARVRAEVLPGKEFPGVVERVAPYLNPSTRQASVRVSVPNRGRELKPGMFIQVEIEFAQKAQARIVPEACVVTREDRTGVFLVDPQGTKVSFVPIQVGIREGGNVEILSPPLSGSVVITGQHLLQDGTPVIVAGRGRS